MNGGSGEEQLLGGGGNDEIWGGADSDWLEGQDGNDTLYGTAAKSTTITTAQAETLIAWTTDEDSGATVWSSTTAVRNPVNQIWAVVLDAATSATADIDVWVAALP